METIVDFVGKVSDMVRKSMDETNSCIGKEFVDTTAGKKGICVDRVTNFFGTKISFLGVKYEKEEQEKLDRFNTDVLVCQTACATRSADFDHPLGLHFACVDDAPLCDRFFSLSSVGTI